MRGIEMNADERAIRELLVKWHRATAQGDVDAVLRLMPSDVVFLVPGEPPMRGRDAFESGLRAVLAAHRIESSSDIQEIVVVGDLAYCWSVLDVVIVARRGGVAHRRSGSALSILRKQPSGEWLLVRDANLLPPPRQQSR
jgi:uncharacterized protein (TIGR02246 family)